MKTTNASISPMNAQVIGLMVVLLLVIACLVGGVVTSRNSWAAKIVSGIGKSPTLKDLQRYNVSVVYDGSGNRIDLYSTIRQPDTVIRTDDMTYFFPNEPIYKQREDVCIPDAVYADHILSGCYVMVDRQMWLVFKSGIVKRLSTDVPCPVSYDSVFILEDGTKKNIVEEPDNTKSIPMPE